MLHLPPLTLAILLASGCFAEYWSDSVENAVRVEVHYSIL